MIANAVLGIALGLAFALAGGLVVCCFFVVTPPRSRFDSLWHAEYDVIPRTPPHLPRED